MYCSLTNTACCSYCCLHMYCITCCACALSQTELCRSLLAVSAAALSLYMLLPVCCCCSAVLSYLPVFLLLCRPHSLCYDTDALSQLPVRSLSQHAACMHGLCHCLVSLYCITPVLPRALSAALLLCLALFVAALLAALCTLRLLPTWQLTFVEPN